MEELLKDNNKQNKITEGYIDNDRNIPIYPRWRTNLITDLKNIRTLDGYLKFQSPDNATPLDLVIENLDLDKSIYFRVNDGGVATNSCGIDGDTADFEVLNGNKLNINNSNNTKYASIYHNGTNTVFDSSAGRLQLNPAGGYVELLAGCVLRLRDSDNSDDMMVYHNGTDVLFSTTAGDFIFNPAGNQVCLDTGTQLYVYDTDNSNKLELYNDGTDSVIADGIGDIRLEPGGLQVKIMNGAQLQVNSAGDDKYGLFYHDDTNVIISASSGSVLVESSVKCRAYSSAAQNNLTADLATLVTLDAETYDDGSGFNTTTHLYTAPVTGTYLIVAQVTFDGADMADAKKFNSMIYVNGASVANSRNQSGVAGTYSLTCPVSSIEKVTAGQTIGLYAMSSNGNNLADIDVGTTDTFMCIHLLSIE